MASERCQARTRAGHRCPTGARASGYCHVHDPAAQCQILKPNGQRCTVATGGGRCATHRAATDDEGQDALFD